MATSTNKDVIQTDQVFTGAMDAPVTLVCYIDYESVACERLNQILNQVLADFEGKIKINIRHFPMANKHQKAMKAAEAAVAAAQEGLFWPMHNILFANQKKLGTISLKLYAKEIGTNNKRFLDQVINGVYAWQVREDLMDGLNKGIRAAPAVFVNGELFGEDFNVETLSKKIEEFL
jgi:protein-disulfide isomerase